MDLLKNSKQGLLLKVLNKKKILIFFDTFSPVTKVSSIRLLIAIAAIHNLMTHQVDVKTVFLNGDLEEEIYMNQPQGFTMPGNEHKVCIIKIFIWFKTST